MAAYSGGCRDQPWAWVQQGRPGTRVGAYCMQMQIMQIDRVPRWAPATAQACDRSHGSTWAQGLLWGYRLLASTHAAARVRCWACAWSCAPARGKAQPTRVLSSCGWKPKVLTAQARALRESGWLRRPWPLGVRLLRRWLRPLERKGRRGAGRYSGR